MLSWLDFKRTCTKWVNAVFKIMFKSMFVKVTQAELNLVSNFRPKGWWIPYIQSGVGRPSLSKVFLHLLKDFALRNFKSSLFHSQIV